MAEPTKEGFGAIVVQCLFWALQSAVMTFVAVVVLKLMEVIK